MTGIQEHEADEDEELQFHVELDANPPPTPTVATFDTYILNRQNDLESSGPEKNHALSEPQDNTLELEPGSPNSLHFIWDHFDKIQSTPEVMAAQAMEALNRTFIELKSKNDETRARASYDLRDLVVSAARGKAFYSPRSCCTS